MDTAEGLSIPSDQRQELLSAELRAADLANRDLRALPDLVAGHRERLTEYYRGLNPAGNIAGKQEYWIARLVRRIPMRVVSDRYCRALLPEATRIISPDSAVVSQLAADGYVESWTQADGARSRNYSGNRALIFQAMRHLILENVAPRIFDGIPAAELSLLFATYSALTRIERETAAGYYVERFGHPIADAMLTDPFGEWTKSASPPVNPDEQEVAFIAGSLQTDLGELLTQNNIPSQAEFMAVAMTDLGVGLDARGTVQAMCNIVHIGALAALTARKATELVFGDVRTHRPLWGHRPDGSLVPARPPLTPDPLLRPHRCVGPDWLPAISADYQQRADSFAAAVARFAGGEPIIDFDPRRISAATVISAYAIGVAAQLGALGALS